MDYNKLTKKELIAIAKEKEVPGRAKAIKAKGTQDLIKLLEDWDNKNQTEATQPEPTPTQTPEQSTIPTPQEFFNQVKGLNSKMEVHQACNNLLDSLAERYAVTTISRKLSEYTKPFYNFQHTSNDKLNETVDTAKGKNRQHIAANLLSLSEEQSKQLKQDRQQSEASRLGIDEDGDIRDVELPTQKIKSIVQKAQNLLTSTKPEDIACGLLPLTGFRRNEQNMPSIEYDSGVIVREWKVIGEFLIAIKGLSKKGGNGDWFARPTLVPAQKVVDAQKIFLATPEVKAIPSNYQAYSNGGFRKAMDRRFKEIWDDEFSTIEAYDDDSNKTKNNASTHKARAFYTWALVPVLKANGFNQKQAKIYVQKCLGHDDSKDTEKYFNRYDENQFIEGIDINIPINFNEVGQMSNETVERLNKAYYESKETEDKVTVTKDEKSKSNKLDVNKFVDGIPEDLQVKFTELMNSGTDITNALIQTVSAARSTQSQTETKPPVSDKIDEIIVAVMDYNEGQPEIKNYLVPTYAAVNRIHKQWVGKQIARSTFDDVWKEKERDITERLANKDIPNISRDDAKSQGLISQEMHNGKFHRKDMDNVVAKIIKVIEG